MNQLKKYFDAMVGRVAPRAPLWKNIAPLSISGARGATRPTLVPAGRLENSPAFQRRVGGKKFLSPEGASDLNTIISISTVPSGLEPRMMENPALKRRAISKRSFGTDLLWRAFGLQKVFVAVAIFGSFLCPHAFAQDAVGPFISTVGTTVKGKNTGRDWAYLIWTANSSTLLNGRTHAIYSKPGDATSATPFTRIAIISLQSEAITLAPLLGRAALLGEDTNTLTVDIDALFGKFVPAGLTLPEKLSAVVRGAIVEEKHYGRLILLSRAHPSVAMALGFAHAELIPAGQTTFEIREFDRGTQTDGAVIGRVTVTAGAPTILPAPGVAVELPQPNPRGHLNTQLRWGVPDPLRRLSLLQHGYNVWRVPKNYAETRNWNVIPPSPATLVSNSMQTNVIRRVNRLPLLVSKVFTDAEAANVAPPTGDTNTFFIIDDNDRGRSNVFSTLDFTNGARFYYFVTARDILGRDGLLSLGKEIQICNKLPPDALSRVDVANDFSWQTTSNRHRLRVNWDQAPNLPLDEQRIKAYWVYRWTNITDLRMKQGNPTNNRIAIINHIVGKTTNSFLDAGANSPSPTTDMGKTFWYTIRAEDDGACYGNLSPHSAPAFGVLRDRVGPAAPTGTIETICYSPDIKFLGKTTSGSGTNSLFDDTFQLNIVAVRNNRRIEWVEFRAEVHLNGSSTNVLASYSSGRLHFGPGQPGAFVNFPFDVRDNYDGNLLLVYAKTGFADGTSDNAPAESQLLNFAKGDVRVTFLYSAKLDDSERRFGCDYHFAVGTNNTLVPINISIQPTATSRELRVYRRIDDGPLDLIYQKRLSNLALVTIPDDTFPHGGGKVCYYSCVVDENGNSSPLTSLGCTLTIETSEPPVPQLSPIVPSGPPESPQMVLSWFCPSVNLDRFEVGIAAVGGTISPNCAPGFLDFITPPPEPDMEPLTSEIISSQSLPLAQSVLEFQRFITPRPNADFGNNENKFVVPVDIELGRRYVVYVKSITKSGARSTRSNLEGFIWQATNAPQPDVPWPARPLPLVGNSFGIEFSAVFNPLCGDTNVLVPCVRLVQRRIAVTDFNCPQLLSGEADPNLYLPKNNSGESLFPVALFRQQIANTDFPTVSGDTVQVTPMMESIAWGNDLGRARIYDPYILMQESGSSDGGGIVLRDTQPIISGSRYRYFLVRFNSLGEIAETIPVANELEVP